MANADLIVNNVPEIKNGTKINDDVNEKGHWNNVYIKKIVNEIFFKYTFKENCKWNFSTCSCDCDKIYETDNINDCAKNIVDALEIICEDFKRVYAKVVTFCYKKPMSSKLERSYNYFCKNSYWIQFCGISGDNINLIIQSDLNEKSDYIHNS